MRILNVGIIGQGRSGWDIHGKHLAGATDLFRVVGVADLVEERRKHAAERHKCDVYPDYRELLARSDLDLVVNATPTPMHVPVSIECLRKGLNVLSEKPAAWRVADLDRVFAAARQARRFFTSFQNWRYTPYFQEALRVARSGVLGRLVEVRIAFNGFSRRWDWQTLRKMHGGSLLNTGPHPVDWAIQFLGAERMPEVTCAMDRAQTFGDAEDHVKILLRTPGRPVVDIEISCCCAHPSRILEIYGTRGGLLCDRNKVSWRYIEPGEHPAREIVPGPMSDAAGLPVYCREELKWHEESTQLDPALNFATSVGRFYEMLHATLTASAPFDVKPEEVRRQVAIIQACHRQNPPQRMGRADVGSCREG